MANDFAAELSLKDTFAVPELLSRPDNEDYLSEEESDSGPAPEIKIPELNDLLFEFESQDETITAIRKESLLQQKDDQNIFKERLAHLTNDNQKASD